MILRNKYSICTLVTDHFIYDIMRKSFINNGFTKKDCEYFIVDNNGKNFFDAYHGLNHMIGKATGEFIICCHQDIQLIDNRQNLEKRIEQLNSMDDSWAVISNCGAGRVGEYALRVTEGDGIIYDTKNFPFAALSVDEHFVLIKNKTGLNFSHDLNGFHFYGTDICLHAKIKGYNSYCVDFHVKHSGGGKKDKNYFKCKLNLINKYSGIMNLGWMQTTCERIYISNNKIKNILFNTNMVSYLKKKQMKRKKSEF